MKIRGSRRRRWWGLLGLAVLVAAPALALTTITITGMVTTVSSDVTPGSIMVGDPFEIVVMFEESELMGGVESVTSANNTGFGFSLNVDGLSQSAADDRFGSPVLTLDNGAFSALQFASTDYLDFGPLAFTNLTPVGPLGALTGMLEILNATGANQNQPLILGTFTDTAVSVN